ncbi:antibiotic biosynthesis monooxygenase [Heyndrickxia sporothermodurans]|uniref:putative quinol monooxygenase n=1 Tax=Heyndrickxia sporothermodurans TaxID=46224 RepID=UPI000D3647C5|nr:putative quinol monooxygenase [Heyndrickxia sporothermodurans]MBL5766379.1 antibiotic biosynthesis monooxygenase [Heyndrickxia sporothermodurans]MBL5769818.1 antibiotic biosynthesis monooxygenase [Heyndrickxia sporothermodurans]MBL5774010.1 antibiotic biosynthesis monooxygenase [Heyndrickxia sporothermodurans]MBL5776898.1 antibiotic biosynthesis monooxygenase [Heyndrickxia sporothermodurans]MBL5782589.1 antibiotic biosynthesis monooxygenase [Heyndrickxia sporothermodurans]
MIIVHATFQVNPAKENLFLEEIKSLIAASREENGNISYGIQKDVENEHVYMMIELWKDMDAAAGHNSSDHFTKFVAKAKDFLTAPVEIKAYEGQQLKL